VYVSRVRDYGFSLQVSSADALKPKNDIPNKSSGWSSRKSFGRENNFSRVVI